MWLLYMKVYSYPVSANTPRLAIDLSLPYPLKPNVVDWIFAKIHATGYFQLIAISQLFKFA